MNLVDACGGILNPKPCEHIPAWHWGRLNKAQRIYAWTWTVLKVKYVFLPSFALGTPDVSEISLVSKVSCRFPCTLALTKQAGPEMFFFKMASEIPLIIHIVWLTIFCHLCVAVWSVSWAADEPPEWKVMWRERKKIRFIQRKLFTGLV